MSSGGVGLRGMGIHGKFHQYINEISQYLHQRMKHLYNQSLEYHLPYSELLDYNHLENKCIVTFNTFFVQIFILNEIILTWNALRILVLFFVSCFKRVSTRMRFNLNSSLKRQEL